MMAEGKGLREVAWLDCAGGGQVVLDGDRAYIGHIDAPHGTSVVDVSDPKHPRITASVDIPAGLHSHKVWVANDIMLANRERTLSPIGWRKKALQRTRPFGHGGSYSRFPNTRISERTSDKGEKGTRRRLRTLAAGSSSR
jgi:hypothetical protein